MSFDYARWPSIAETNGLYWLLALADVGVREIHYDFARRYPERYPGHSGGSMTCTHADCESVADSIRRAVTREE